MQQIIFFFIRNKNLLLFLLLFTTAIGFTVNSRSYHRDKLLTSANFFSGGIFSIKQAFLDYFELKEQNNILSDENNRLRQLLLEVGESESPTATIETSRLPYAFRNAKVINNSFSRSKNHLTINKGSKQGIAVDMGVITSTGIVGIVNSVSANYATIQSVLNTNSQVNAKLKNTDHFGILKWNTGSPYEAQLVDIPKQVNLKQGDSIVTDGKSTIFPEGIMIGTIKEINLDSNEDYYLLTIALSADMTNVRHVYVIENSDKAEILELENELEDAE